MLLMLSDLVIVATPLQNCGDFLKFYFKIHFLKSLSNVLFSLSVIVSVELSVACNIHIGENKRDSTIRALVFFSIFRRTVG